LEVCPEINEAHPNGSAPRPVTCRVCGHCADVCPTGARKLAGQERTVDEILELVLRDCPFYGRRGGVTLSGGEPLAQWPFARLLADRLRSAAVHVAIDTACVAPPDVIREVPEHVDLVLADLKLVTPESHSHWTGADNDAILEAIRFWSVAMPGRLWISVPVIPDVQDQAEFQRIATFCRTLENAPPVRLIPYHRLGESKYEALGWPVPAFSGSVDEHMDKARTTFVRRGTHILEEMT
jgi:pyruvate formate lyase activating enzyme